VITLYTFGPAFGLPDPSPFVTKAEMLLKLAGLPYRTDSGGFRKAPKGKLPYIEDDGTRVADSTFIRFHLEGKHGIDFDPGLTPEQKAVAWAVEKMCEDHLYWAVVHDRWIDDANFERGPARFFERAPAPIRPLVKMFIRRQVRGKLDGHGMGRHAPADIARLARRDLDALAAVLGDKAFLMGERPCGADATVFAFVAGVLCPVFETPTRHAAEGHANLVAYRDRLIARYYPELAKAA
jgi:glutathione S-transferase